MTDYDQFAKSFSDTRKKAWQEFDLIFEMINDLDLINPTILDVGCGNSRFFKYLSDKNYICKYIGLDKSKKMLDISKSFYPQNIYINDDMINISKYANFKFDIIVSIAAFHHILSYDQQILFLKSIYDINPKLFVFTVWNLLSQKNISKYNPNKIVDNYISIPFGKEKYERKYFVFSDEYLDNLIENSRLNEFDIKKINTEKNIIVSIKF